MGAKESNIQQSVIEYCKKNQVLCINIHGGGWTGKGCPDLLLCINGKFCAMELKTPKGALSAAQRVFKKRIERAGGNHACPTSLHEAVQWIEFWKMGGDG